MEPSGALAEPVATARFGGNHARRQTLFRRPKTKTQRLRFPSVRPSVLKARLHPLRALLQVGLFTLAIAAFPRPASAQWIWNDTWAEPNPFTQEDEITVHVDAEWDTETWEWPCDTIEMDGACYPVDHQAYVWGSDGFWDYDWQYDYGGGVGYEPWEFWDNYGPVYMEPIGYSTAVVVDYCDEYYNCWSVEADSGTEVDPDGPTITSDNGDTVWWFDGEDPDPSNFPTSLTLTSSAGSQTTWTVYSQSEFGQPVELSTSQGETTVVTANSVGSGSVHDTYIVASVGSASGTLQVTARRPMDLATNVTGVSPNPNTSCPGPTGYAFETRVYYYVRDNLQAVTATLGVNEAWTTAVSLETTYQPPYQTDWWRPSPPNNIQTNESGVFYDLINVPSAWQAPAPGCGVGSDTTKVDRWGQAWRVGSSVSGRGACVQTDTLQRYLGRGAHLSPVSPPSGSCQ